MRSHVNWLKLGLYGSDKRGLHFEIGLFLEEASDPLQRGQESGRDQPASFFPVILPLMSRVPGNMTQSRSHVFLQVSEQNYGLVPWERLLTQSLEHSR